MNIKLLVACITFEFKYVSFFFATTKITFATTKITFATTTKEVFIEFSFRAIVFHILIFYL